MYMNYTIVYMHKLVHILPTSSEWMPTNNLHVWDGINQQSGFQREGRDGGDGDGGGAAVVD